MTLWFLVVAWAVAFAELSVAAAETCEAKRPNIVFIFTDDQDQQLGSIDYMKNVKDLLMANGATFTNHFATVSQCCPSRASLFRGQHAHNTNITHVGPPGGNYAKWLKSNENNNYLPHWLRKAGYRTEYVGKFLNGYNTALYQRNPKGWDMADVLVEPWTYHYNTPVFSQNGANPMLYEGYHQTDVIRAKALSRLRFLTENQDQPFYLTIAPVSPHVETPGPPVPLKRHAKDFPGIIAPRPANFNPNDQYTSQKPSWLKKLPALDDGDMKKIDNHFRRRIQALQGVDEIVQDVVEFLDKKGILDETYIVYSSDNGYHLGQHRVGGGKTLPYIEDTNIPFIVRGPGVPKGLTSRIPGTHLDLAPTFLDIACVSRDSMPVFFDGKSLLEDWRNNTQSTGASDTRDILNIEFWGPGGSEGGIGKNNDEVAKNSYKTLRLVGEDNSWLYSKWCTGETELYNTLKDAGELENMAINPDAETQRLIQRLDALLMVTKSCNQDTCQNPWSVLQSECRSQDNCPHSGAIFADLGIAMDPKYDFFFENLPKVQFKECLEYQDSENEGPYLPASSTSLGRKHRDATDNYVTPHQHGPNSLKPLKKHRGTKKQRNVQLEEMEKKARKLTPGEMGAH